MAHYSCYLQNLLIKVSFTTVDVHFLCEGFGLCHDDRRRCCTFGRPGCY